MRALVLTCCLLLPIMGFCSSESEGRVIHCATSEEVRAALKEVGPGDTIMLEGGKTYETDRTFKLRASGIEESPIRFTSQDPDGQGRFAVITTVDGRKEPSLVAVQVAGSWWVISQIEISGSRVPLADGYWDTNGFQLGIYLLGAGSHHNVVEDVHIHDTHNAAIAMRDESHHNTFRRMNIHHIGEWLHEDYNAHEGEGFYLGSSKSFTEEGNKALVHDILIEDSTIGPGLLGQFVDIKYAASAVTVRNNIFHCGEKSWNEEVVSVSGYANRIENNRFAGSNPQLTRYIRVFHKKTDGPVRVDYKGQSGIAAPTGFDNIIVNNRFYTDDPSITVLDNDLKGAGRATLTLANNPFLPLAEWKNEANINPD
jgi:hypothetical protein